jgi:hypothetical protein
MKRATPFAASFFEIETNIYELSTACEKNIDGLCQGTICGEKNQLHAELTACERKINCMRS